MSFEKMRFKEWMAKFRPDGVGRIQVAGFDPIEFEEVVCDFCNAEIPPTKEDGTENEVYCTDGYAVCKTCAEEAIK